ncbi:MAG TPA: helix-turn-helix transcriptional regulator [Sphingomicrobium sp.]|jgi:DNA-binding CsgD family transcriptional regulator
MDDSDSLSRLTEGEKVCLRQWLQHKSAKEIAADLGISHHAVEKRLKMARTKLRATSSLEAARMLGGAEGYGPTVAQSPDLVRNAVPLHSSTTRLLLVGVAIMILTGAIVLGLLLQPAASSQAANNQPVESSRAQGSSRGSGPTAGTEAALRMLVAGLASGSPDYKNLSPEFAEVVRRDLPTTHPMFRSMGELKSVTFEGRGAMGDDVYNLAFAKGGMTMSVLLDFQGRMAGGVLRPAGERTFSPASEPSAGTEAALRRLVAGLASGSPEYGKLSPQFAEVVRRDLPMTHPLFSSMGQLQSVNFRGRGSMGDDVYDLVFAKGGMTMSVVLDSEGRMAGGLLRPARAPER